MRTTPSRSVVKLLVLNVLFLVVATVSLRHGGLLKPAESVLRSGPRKEKRPHVVMFVIDDQGMNDMGPNSTDLAWATPRLEALANRGVRLTRYYTMHLCTPARAALLTGKYPMHTGMQHSMISDNEPWGLPPEETLLSEYAKDLGYATALVGKWHLGHYKPEFTPLRRGFHRFFGYYAGFQDHFEHVSEVSFCATDNAGCWYDLRDGAKPVSRPGEYTLFVLRDEARSLIKAHDVSTPLFLFFASPTVHMPVQPPNVTFPPPVAERLAAIPNSQRRAFAEMTVATDIVAGDLVDALHSRSMWHDTVFVCLSDNGAQPQVSGAGSNYPFRGMKGYYFEGGVRTHAFIHYKELASGTYDYLFHAVDWIPTLFGVATADGVKHDFKTPARTEIVVNGDLVTCDNASVAECDAQPFYPTGAVIFNSSWKLLRNVIWLPVWPVPDTDVVTPMPGWTSQDFQLEALDDYLYHIQDDPTESRDLKAVYPDVYEFGKQLFSERLNSMLTPAYCPVSDDHRAKRAFADTRFLGPWLDDNQHDRIELACLTGAIDAFLKDDDDAATSGKLYDIAPGPDSSSTSAQHTNKARFNSFPTTDYCRYGLLPEDSLACNSSSAPSLPTADDASGSARQPRRPDT